MLTIGMQQCESMFHSLLHSADLVEGALRRRLAELGVMPRQARVLDALDRMGEVHQVQLARAFDLAPASMSTMVSRLVAAGYVTRVSDPGETRSNIVALSDRGRSMLADIREAWADIDRLIRAKLGDEKAARLSDLTEELRDALGGRIPGAE